jgi:hypothetical protein
MLSQFIYGKFIRDAAESKIVARTRDLMNQKHLETITETHRFWKLSPPRLSARAIGMFIENEHLILCQGAIATDPQGRLVNDYFEREIPQIRYVLIPLKELEKWQRSLFQILLWLNRQPIPVFQQPVSYQEGQSVDLLPLELPEFAPDLQQVEAIRSTLTCTNRQGEPLLLDAISAAFTQQRILTYFSSTSQMQDFLKSFLLLLPVAIRSQFSIAMGIFDEACCSWADLLLKINPPLDDLPTNAVELTQETVSGIHCEYVTEVIQPVLQGTDDQVEQLLKGLDTIPKALFQSQGESAPEMILHLIPHLSKNHRIQLEDRYLSKLRIEQWATILQRLPDDDTVLLIVWESLLKLTAQQPMPFIQLLLELWKRLSSDRWSQLVADLHLYPVLAAELLQSNLLQIAAGNAEIVPALRTLCHQVVEFLFHQEPDASWELAHRLVQEPLFRENCNRFQLFDRILNAVKTDEQLIKAFNTTLGCLLPNLAKEQVLESRFYQLLSSSLPKLADLLRSLLEKRELRHLVEIAHLTRMTLPEQDRFYTAFLAAWANDAITAQAMLRHLVEQSLLSTRCQIDEQLPDTYDWIARQVPDWSDAISQLNRVPDWSSWKRLAAVLYEDIHDQILFLERYVGSTFPVDVFQHQIPLIAANSETRSMFLETSLVWQSLQFNTLSQVIPNVPQHIEMIADCLKQSRRFSWFRGTVLHYLLNQWIEQGRVNPDLRSLITSPEVMQHFEPKDWLQLQRAAWILGSALQLPIANRPMLDLQFQQMLVQAASQRIEESNALGDRKRVLADCHLWGISLKAKCHLLLKVVQTPLTPDQTRTLLQEDCPYWDMDFEQQKQILQQVQPESCDVALVLFYVDRDSQTADLVDNRALIDLLERLPLRDEADRQQRDQFYGRIFSNRLQSNARHASILSLCTGLD